MNTPQAEGRINGDPRPVVLQRARQLVERPTPTLALWLLAEYMRSVALMTDWTEELNRQEFQAEGSPGGDVI